jgi:hypothetical protein
MSDQNHLGKFSSAMVVKIHFGDDEERVDQSTEIKFCMFINPLNAEFNPICCLLALVGTHHIFHVRGLRVNKIITILAHCFRLYTVRF